MQIRGVKRGLWVPSVGYHNLNMMFEAVGLEGVLLNRHLDLDLMYNVLYERAVSPSEPSPLKPHQKVENPHLNILTTT